MRILFLGLTSPCPPTNGQALRNLALLRAFVGEGHDITWLSFYDPEKASSARGELGSLCKDVELIPLPGCQTAGRRDILGRLRSLFSLEPHGVRRFRSGALRERMAQLLETCQFDTVICDDIYLFANLPADTPVPVLLNKHDLTHVLFRRYADMIENPVKRVYAAIESLKVHRWERLACSACDVVLAASNVDRGLISSMAPRTPIVVVPNALDCSRYTVAPQRRPDRFDLLYFGAMDFYPNQDAVQFLISEILPNIRQHAPKATLAIVGRNMPNFISSRVEGMQGVRCVNGVPDMREIIAASSICLVPLRIGSGTRLKILEAAAMERPVISTTVGAEGLGFVHGKDILIADDPEAFAAAAISLLRDADSRRSIGAAARVRVEREYSLPVVRKRVAEALEITAARAAFSYT